MNTNARALSSRLADLLRAEQGAMADFLLALADFDRRRLWIDLGYASLFVYLHRELGLSRSAAHYRKTAVELIQRFPPVEVAFRSGRLCLTTSFELARVLTPQNLDDVLPRFFGAVAAGGDGGRRLDPARRDRSRAHGRDARTRAAPQARVLVAPEASEAATAAPVAAAPAPDAQCLPVGTSSPVPVPAPRPVEPPARAEVQPLTAERSRIHVTVDRGFHARLEEARNALSHAHPNASDGDILELALEALLERAAKRKGSARGGPRRRVPPGASTSRRTSARPRSSAPATAASGGSPRAACAARGAGSSRITSSRSRSAGPRTS